MAAKFERIIYVPFDHLNFDRGAMKLADPTVDVLVWLRASA